MRRINGNLEAFEEGQLCYIVKRKYKGKGKPVLILHEATINTTSPISFIYGGGKTWLAKIIPAKETK